MNAATILRRSHFEHRLYLISPFDALLSVFAARSLAALADDEEFRMNRIASFRHAATACAVCVLVACSHGTSTPAQSGSTAPSPGGTAAPAANAWTANGATACDRYLTPAIVAEILKNPAGHSKPTSAWSCSYETSDDSSIGITLMAVGTAGLDAHLKYLVDPAPLAGVGDKAVRTAIGIEAAKGANRTCSIDAIPPFAMKVSGEALAQKLGAICNQLFALP